MLNRDRFEKRFKLEIRAFFSPADWQISMLEGATIKAFQLNNILEQCVNDREFTSHGTRSVVGRHLEKIGASQIAFAFLDGLLAEIYKETMA